MEDGIPGWLQYYHEMCYKKGGRHGRRACMILEMVSPQERYFRTGGLTYDNIVSKSISWLLKK